MRRGYRSLDFRQCLTHSENNSFQTTHYIKVVDQNLAKSANKIISINI